jgi:hypothetical protein
MQWSPHLKCIFPLAIWCYALLLYQSSLGLVCLILFSCFPFKLHQMNANDLLSNTSWGATLHLFSIVQWSWRWLWMLNRKRNASELSNHTDNTSRRTAPQKDRTTQTMPPTIQRLRMMKLHRQCLRTDNAPNGSNHKDDDPNRSNHKRHASERIEPQRRRTQRIETQKTRLRKDRTAKTTPPTDRTAKDAPPKGSNRKDFAPQKEPFRR